MVRFSIYKGPLVHTGDYNGTDVHGRRHTDRCEKNVERKNKRLNGSATGLAPWARSSSASPAHQAPSTASA